MQQIANAVPLEVNNPRNSLASHFSFKRDLLQLEKIIHWKEAQNPLCPLFIEIREGSHQASPAPSRVPRPSDVNVTFVRLKNDLKCKIAATIFVSSKLISTSWFSSPSMRFWHNVFPLHCFAILKRSAGILTSNEEHYPPQWHPSRPLANPPCCRRTLLCPERYQMSRPFIVSKKPILPYSCCCHHSCHSYCQHW